MSEQQMPERIWAHSNGQNYWLDYQPTYTRSTEFIRADIAERMAEALEDLLKICGPNIYAQPDKPDSPWGKMESARSALSAFKDSAQ